MTLSNNWFRVTWSAKWSVKWSFSWEYCDDANGGNTQRHWRGYVCVMIFIHSFIVHISVCETSKEKLSRAIDWRSIAWCTWVTKRKTTPSKDSTAGEVSCISLNECITKWRLHLRKINSWKRFDITNRRKYALGGASLITVLRVSVVYLRSIGNR